MPATNRITLTNSAWSDITPASGRLDVESLDGPALLCLSATNAAGTALNAAAVELKPLEKFSITAAELAGQYVLIRSPDWPPSGRADVFLAPAAAAAGGGGGATTPSRYTPTDRSGTITAGGTQQPLAPANASRNGFFIQNLGTTDLWFSTIANAVIGQPSNRLLPGESARMPSDAVFTGAISVISATTGHPFAAREW